MPAEVRAARADEFPLIREIIARAFQGDEPALWDHLVAHDPDLRPEHVRVAVADGRPVACTVVLPRQIRGRAGPVPGAIITLVACHPEHQNRGYGGRTVQDALDWMTGHGLVLAVLYGHPDYYPRFGFAPVLAGFRTLLPAAPGPDLRPALPADLPALAALYADQVGRYPCAVARPAQSWLWQPRNPAEHGLLVLPDGRGYAFVSASGEADHLHVHEAAADADAGWRLLAALQGEAHRRGKAQLRLGLPTDHRLVRMALLRGAVHSYHPAGPGMAAITRWEPLLPPGYRVGGPEGAGGEAAAGVGLYRDGRLVLTAPRAALVQLVLGYRHLDDLLLLPECRPGGDEADREELRRDFPAACPRWSLAPFWH